MDQVPATPEQPEGTNVLQRMEQSNIFQGVTITAVLLNTHLLAMEAEAEDPGAAQWEHLDQAFLTFFVCEISFRLAAYRCEFFRNKEWKWNTFDLTIVALGVLDQWVMPLLEADSSQKMAKLIMIFRVLRVLRVLRAFRLFRQFKKLKILARGLLDSLQSVFWVALLFALVIFSYAIVITKLAGKNWQQFDAGEDQEVVKDKFGTIPKSMETLFIFLTCDDWSTPARIVNKKMPYMQFVWVTYIVLGVFTLLSLLTGLMADKMNEERTREEENEAAEKADKLELFLDNLKVMFDKADTSGDAMVDVDEFKEMLCNRKVAKKMQECGLPAIRAQETSEIFQAMDRDRDGQLPWEEFRDGLIQLSKPFTSKDIMWLESSILKLDRMLAQHDASGHCIDWDHRLDRVHAHATLISERLAFLERSLSGFFDRVGYRPA